MHWLARFFQKEKSEKQLDDELQFHLERQTADLIARGLTPEDARRQAMLAFGGVEPIKEDCREARRLSFLEILLQDLRFASRMLRKNPAFTIAAAITLALGIGANTAIFSIVNAVILRPLPYKDSSRIVAISTHTPMFPTFSLGLPWIDFQLIRSQAASLEQAAAYSEESKTLTGKGDPSILSVVNVSEDFFDELGANPVQGRLLTREDHQPQQNHVIVISSALWHTRFGASPSALGQVLVLDKIPYTIVGVAAPGFVFPEKTDAWVPLSLTPEEQHSHTYFMLQTIAKLRPGQKMEKLQAELDTISGRIVKDNPEVGPGLRFNAASLLEKRIEGTRPAYLILLGAATLVLLISCANLASMLLARGSGRQREMAVRAALGASASRLFRQGIVESCLLALLGGALGILLAAGGVRLFRAIAPATTPRLDEVSLDATLLWFSLLTALVAGVLFGIVPVRRAARTAPSDALKGGVGTASSSDAISRKSRLGSVLVALEVALAFVLIAGSVLMTLTVSRLLHQNPGFRTDHLLTLDLPSAYPSPSQDFEAWTKKRVEFTRQIVEQVGSVPGASGVTAADHGMLGGMTMMQADFQVDGALPLASKEERHAGARYVYPSFFRFMEIPLVRGREFTDRDVKGATRVALVNEAMALEYWGTLNVLGKRISLSKDEKGGRIWNEVVGVVADARDVRLREKASPVYFLSMLQGGDISFHLLIRTQTDPQALAGTISRKIWANYPEQPVTNIVTMSQTISDSVGDERLRGILLTVFASVGFFLALVGVYGVVSYAVSRRTQEIGIRIALGASPTAVLGMILGQGLLPVLIGVATGAACTLALARVFASQLYEVQPTDPTTFLATALLVIAVASLACLIPARRASTVDPLIALRYQ